MILVFCLLEECLEAMVMDIESGKEIEDEYIRWKEVRKIEEDRVAVFESSSYMELELAYLELDGAIHMHFPLGKSLACAQCIHFYLDIRNFDRDEPLLF